MTDDYGIDLDVYEIDLDVYDEVLGRGARLQIKTRSSESRETKGLCGFGLVSKRTEISSSHLVLGVLLHMPSNSLAPVRLVPTTELPRVATRKGDCWTLTPNALPSSRDRLAPFRHESMSAVVAVLRAMLKTVPPEPAA